MDQIAALQCAINAEKLLKAANNNPYGAASQIIDGYVIPQDI